MVEPARGGTGNDLHKVDQAFPAPRTLSNGEVLSDLYGLAASRLDGDLRRQLRELLYLDLTKSYRRLAESEAERPAS